MSGATQRFGTTKFTWTDGGAKEHTLAVPLQQVRPSARLKKYERDSINGASHEVWSFGTGVYEVVGVIRYDDAPQSLIDLLLAGARGIAVSYYDDTNTHACYIIGLPEVIDVGFDDDQIPLDEHKIEIRLRKTDGSAFASTIFTG